MALKGLRVVEMAGLAPGPLAGMILAGEILRFFQNQETSSQPCGLTAHPPTHSLSQISGLQ